MREYIQGQWFSQIKLVEINQRQNRSVWCCTDSSSDLLIDSIENTVDWTHETEADDEPNKLGVDPVSHQNVLSVEFNVLWSLLLSSKLKMFHCNDEVSDVTCKSKTDQSVQFKKWTKGSFIQSHHLWDHFVGLINSKHCLINKHKPKDLLHVEGGYSIKASICFSFITVGSIHDLMCFDEFHGGQFKIKCNNCNCRCTSNSDQFVKEVAPVVSSGCDPCTFCSSEEGTSLGSVGSVELLIGSFIDAYCFHLLLSVSINNWLSFISMSI